MGKFVEVDTFYARKQKAFRFEADVHDCEVEGEIPEGLNGSLYRLGPDTAYPTLPGDVIINGDGMISVFHFQDGRVDFRCRYVKTDRFLAERAAHRRLYGKYRNPYTDDPAAPLQNRDNTGNTSAFFHHGRLFALREDSKPYELDPDTLETLAIAQIDPKMASKTMTAHPKIDPDTGEWWSFGLFADRRFDGDMSLQVMDRDGKLIREEAFQAPYPGVAHDFALTEEHVIFPVMPMTVDLQRLKAGGDFYAYDPALPPAWGIMPRKGTAADIRWFEVPRAFAGHIMNAYTEGSVVHVDATISPGNPFTFFKDLHGAATDPAEGAAFITRVSFDMSSRNDNVALTPFPGAVGEMPRCDDRFQSKKYRYGFFKTPGGVGRLDWQTMERVVHPTPDSPPGSQEPIFVPRTPDAAEGDGWLLAVVNRFSENRADLLILDAQNMAGPPVATVRLPFNQPMAFHGMFVPR